MESASCGHDGHGPILRTTGRTHESPLLCNLSPDQGGNLRAPIETEAGWLLLTHGVGPMRQYCIGAILLDLDNPCRVIGQSSEPLLVPTGKERVGYVPNVVYSCGAMIHAGNLILPYAMSDLATSIAVIDLQDLLKSLST